MGSFLGSIQVRSGDAARVVISLRNVAAARAARFMVAPPRAGWVAAYPDNNGQDLDIANHLARHLADDFFQLMVHDSDVFAYRFCRGGRLADEFNSRPDYFGAVSALERSSVAGNPEVYADLLPDGAAAGKIRALLAGAGEMVMAEDVLFQFAALVGLPMVDTAYEYILDGEGAEGMDLTKLIHVPEVPRRPRPGIGLADRRDEDEEDGPSVIGRIGPV